MKLKTFFACLGAVMALVLIIATFTGMNFWSHKFVAVTGLQISPWYTGGEIVKTIRQPDYSIDIHRPVFDGLFSDREEGFIQIDIKPVSAQLNSLPATISTDIDVNNDGQSDFLLVYDTVKNLAQITVYNPAVLSLEDSYILKERRAVRVKLQHL